LVTRCREFPPSKRAGRNASEPRRSLVNCTALISHIFECFDVPSVRAEINFGNRASINLVTRLGFSLVGKDYEENDDIFEMRRDTWTKL